MSARAAPRSNATNDLIWFMLRKGHDGFIDHGIAVGNVPSHKRAATSLAFVRDGSKRNGDERSNSEAGGI
jgi:hypothetical protein